MDLLLILDGEGKTLLSEELRAGIGDAARRKGWGVRAVELMRADTPPCLGCLRCLTRHARVCVYQGSFESLARTAPGCPLVVFLTPVRFGTFSSTVKSIIERGDLAIPRISTCLQVIVGYGEDVDEEERSTFLDITARHRGSANIVHPKMEEHFEAHFCGCAEDGRRICERLGRLMEQGGRA